MNWTIYFENEEDAEQLIRAMKKGVTAFGNPNAIYKVSYTGRDCKVIMSKILRNTSVN